MATRPYEGEINTDTAPSKAVSPNVRIPDIFAGGFALETYQHADGEGGRYLEGYCIRRKAGDSVKRQ